MLIGRICSSWTPSGDGRDRETECIVVSKAVIININSKLGNLLSVLFEIITLVLLFILAAFGNSYSLIYSFDLNEFQEAHSDAADRLNLVVASS